MSEDDKSKGLHQRRVDPDIARRAGISEDADDLAGEDLFEDNELNGFEKGSENLFSLLASIAGPMLRPNPIPEGDYDYPVQVRRRERERVLRERQQREQQRQGQQQQQRQQQQQGQQQHRRPQRQQATNIDDSSNMRTCRICMESSPSTEPQPPSQKWIRPCRCRGTQEWVHLSCLNQWRETAATRNAKCQTCGYEYNIKKTRLYELVTSERTVAILSILSFVIVCYIVSFVADKGQQILFGRTALSPSTLFTNCLTPR